MIYLASSWRNMHYLTVLNELRGAGLNVYDFREQGAAFDWRDIDAEWENRPGTRIEYPPARLIEMLHHPSADRGFERDFAALEACDILIMVAPCGRSAHLELGQAIGRGKPTAIYLPGPHEPELMYRMATQILSDLNGVRLWARLMEVEVKQSA